MRYSIMPGLNLLAAGLAAAALGWAANPVKLSRPTLVLESNKIVVTYDSDEDDITAALPALGNPDNWKVQIAGSDVPLERVAIDVADLTLDLFYKHGAIAAFDRTDIPRGDLIVLYTPLSIRLVVPTAPAKPPKSAGFGSCLDWKLTKDKKKADLDLSGGLQAGVNATPEYFWSVKATCPFVLGDGAKYGRIGPSFTGQAAQQTNADPDSLKAGVTYRKIIAPQETRNSWILSGDVLSYEFERNVKKPAVLSGGAIAQQRFLEKNTNLMWTGMAQYVNAWPQLNWTLGFAGFEAGKALTRTIKPASQSAHDQLVARLHLSLDTYRTFFSKGKPALTFHGSHTVRLPFQPEPFTKADENGGLMYLTDKPRHWTLIEFVFLLSDGAGINVTYKRGSLPPSFEFVDHQVTIGFNLLLKHG